MNLTTELSKRIGRDRKATEALLDALSKSLLQYCGDLDTVAVPTFGSFQAVKHDEQVVIDRSTGRKMLLPPEIELTFKPAGKLRKLIDMQGDE